ncbi:MAG TPA: hypothetical protein PLP13_00755 [bacterium]|nr:hypothetical protein [bacterium]
MIFLPLQKGDARGISSNLHPNLCFPLSFFCKIPFSVLPLFKRGIQGDFKNLPRPFYHSCSPLCKTPPTVLPLFKRGIQGDFEISPNPSFIKRGVIRKFIKMGVKKNLQKQVDGGILQISFLDMSMSLNYVD